MTRRLERLEAASGIVNLHKLLQASEDERDRVIKNLPDAELDRLIDELKADEEGVAI
ncbi:MAG: hypothetical protein O7I42_09985 [Alphaproteobacteria bacterium]|nr:hypothetical protein [Alphaproteobacteria bacterium]